VDTVEPSDPNARSAEAELMPAQQARGSHRGAVTAALKDYDPALDAEDVELAERERAELLERFPREHWPEMELREYAVGQEDSGETYCRWMEFKAVHLGSIKGGSSRKLIIYKRKSRPGWHYDEAAFDSVEEAWAVVRDQFLAAMDYAASDEWTSIDDLDALRAGQAILVKTLHLYFPDDVLPISSREHLRHFSYAARSQRSERLVARSGRPQSSAPRRAAKLGRERPVDEAARAVPLPALSA
jgi:5-methylcytosine-specific restriction protein B